MKKIIIGALLLTINMVSFAQDKHFTQFYSSPLNLNPALTGNMEGRYRAALIYRNQWASVMDKPFNTVSASLDGRFGLKFSEHDKLGFGFVFSNDRAGLATLTTNQIGFAAAYHKALDMQGKQFLSLGFEGGVVQKAINYESLTFNDQFNGSTGYTGSTQEALPTNNVSYGDISTGLFWTFQPSERRNIHAGLALHHLTQPNMNFFRGVDFPKNRLPMKITAHIGAQLPIGDDRSSIALMPRMAAFMQGKHIELNLGTNLRFAMNEYNDMAFIAGIWLRPVGGVKGFGLDAVNALAGIEVKGVRAGISYDVNISDLNLGTSGRGALEISLIYIGNYDVENVICPGF